MPSCANCTGSIAGKPNIQCDCCKREIHIACTGLQVDDRITRNRARCIKIVCNTCSGNIDQLADLKASFDEVKSSLLGKIEALERKFSEVSNNVSTVLNRQTVHDPKEKEAIIQETVDRISRSRNVIVRGVPEVTGSLEERRRHDSAKVSEMLTAMNSSALPISVIRMGKASAGNGGESRPRALKVVLPDRSSAVSVLRNKSKLLEARAYRGVTVSDDKTPAQITYLNELRAELQRRTDDGEPNLTIKYKRGVPEIMVTGQKK